LHYPLVTKSEKAFSFGGSVCGSFKETCGILLLLSRSTIFLSPLVCLAVCTGRISKIGNVFKSLGYVQFGDPLFVDPESAVQWPGVVFGYRAYIANADATLVLQLLRPVPGQKLRFRLVDVAEYSPNSVGEVDVSESLYASHTRTSCGCGLRLDLSHCCSQSSLEVSSSQANSHSLMITRHTKLNG